MPSIKKSSVTEQVAAYIRRKIESGEWKKGEFIPAEIALAAELQVSRTSVRSAVSRFAALGILQSRQGRGSIVICDDVEARMGSVQKLGSAALGDIKKLLQFRLLIEPEAAKLCAALPDRERGKLTQKLGRLLARMRDFVSDPKKFTQADALFHREIAQSCGNELLARILAGTLSRCAATVLDLNTAFGCGTGLFYHEKLLGALISGDSAAAMQCMAHHLQDSLSLQAVSD